MNVYIIVGLIVLLALIAVFVINKKDGQKTEPNYRLFFIVGITWLPLGIATDNAAFLGMGAIFMIWGLVNKDKWKDEPKWSELSPERKKIKMIVVVGLTVLLLTGIATYILAK